jgi:hypothetical protein
MELVYWFVGSVVYVFGALLTLVLAPFIIWFSLTWPFYILGACGFPIENLHTVAFCYIAAVGLMVEGIVLYCLFSSREVVKDTKWFLGRDK